MRKPLFIFIGGSGAQNGDDSAVRKRARSGGTAPWSSLKDVQPGDRVLIYIRQPVSALTATAEVLEPAKRGKPGDYAFRAKVGHFQLLPNPVSLQELRRRFPRWGWLRYPRGKARVPIEYADRLWELVWRKPSTVQILVGNARRGKSMIEQLAESGGSQYWLVPKLAAVGDTALFYVERPVSAIIATGKILSKPRPTDTRWHKASSPFKIWNGDLNRLCS